ncbi:MAG: type II toxin-antitoxin system HicA family toxin [Polyangiaceae bacterium]|nr:type II toxin-antitoxin system HicA family toxin [Polyangiaceae bacterium]
MTSREIIRRLIDDGWVLARVEGSHHQFRHPTKPGTTTVPHPKKDIPVGTAKHIERQSGVKLT